MAQTAEAVREVAERFFAAVERGDIDEVGRIYHPDAVIWHNTDRAETSRADNLRVLAGFAERAPQRAYTEKRLMVTDSGFTQQHLLVASHKDGKRLELPACVICEVKDGLITRLDEYFDNGPLRGWFDNG